VGAGGYTVTKHVGGFGVVAVLKMERGRRFCCEQKRTRCRVTEQTGLPFASTVTTKDDAGNEVGVMHACGHDIHIASLVARTDHGAAHE